MILLSDYFMVLITLCQGQCYHISITSTLNQARLLNITFILLQRAMLSFSVLMSMLGGDKFMSNA